MPPKTKAMIKSPVLDAPKDGIRNFFFMLSSTRIISSPASIARVMGR
jgi:hypothetical protein